MPAVTALLSLNSSPTLRRASRAISSAAAPRHTHLGIEAAVIVQGGFADQSGQYERGDAWIVDASVDHAPVALPGESCLCLVYQDAPLKLTG